VQDALRKALKDGTLAAAGAVRRSKMPQVKEILRKLAGRWRSRTPTSAEQVKTRRAVLHSDEFKALWDRIKHKTTYRVQFDNEAS
jgi:type III restriction enzyme